VIIVLLIISPILGQQSDSTDGPVIVVINMMVRSISKIDDVTMVSFKDQEEN
jgi:hypothetical protein